MKGIISLYLGLTLLIAVIAALLFGSIGMVEGDVSAASTILSILSTICVGILSYAQGALHNEMTAPKIYKASSDEGCHRITDKNHCYNAFFHAKHDKAMQQIDCGVFRMVNAPLVAFTVKSITIIKKKILFFTLSKQTIKLVGNSITLSDADTSFRLVLFLPSGLIEPLKECRIIAECADVWGKRVKIKCSFSIDGDTWLPKQWKIVNKVI